MTTSSRVDRRTYLKAVGAVGTAGVLAGCTDGDEPPSNGEESDDDGGVGPTTVLVGPEGQFVFEPESLTIDVGTTVEFVWESDTHNLVIVEGPEDGWEGYETIENEGFVYEHTFEIEGTYEYVCEPHEAEGMFGTITVQ